MTERFVGTVSARCDRCQHDWIEHDVPSTVLLVTCPSCRAEHPIIWLTPAVERISAVPERLPPRPKNERMRSPPSPPPMPPKRPLTRAETLKVEVFWGNVTVDRVMRLDHDDLSKHVSDSDLLRCEQTCWAYMTSDTWGGKWPLYAVRNRWVFIRDELAYRRRKRLHHERPWGGERGRGHGEDPFAGTVDVHEIVDPEDEELPLEIGLRLPVDMVLRERFSNARIPMASTNESASETDAQLRARVERKIRRRNWTLNLTSLQVVRTETFAPTVLN